MQCQYFLLLAWTDSLTHEYKCRCRWFWYNDLTHQVNVKSPGKTSQICSSLQSWKQSYGGQVNYNGSFSQTVIVSTSLCKPRPKECIIPTTILLVRCALKHMHRTSTCCHYSFMFMHRTWTMLGHTCVIALSKNFPTEIRKVLQQHEKTGIFSYLNLHN